MTDNQPFMNDQQNQNIGGQIPNQQNLQKMDAYKNAMLEPGFIQWKPWTCCFCLYTPDLQAKAHFYASEDKGDKFERQSALPEYQFTVEPVWCVPSLIFHPCKLATYSETYEPTGQNYVWRSSGQIFNGDFCRGCFPLWKSSLDLKELGKIHYAYPCLSCMMDTNIEDSQGQKKYSVSYSKCLNIANYCSCFTFCPNKIPFTIKDAQGAKLTEGKVVLYGNFNPCQVELKFPDGITPQDKMLLAYTTIFLP